LFQRPYSWDRPQWNTLWDDIHELATEGARKTHFMGAIVTMPAQTNPAGITKSLLIDGQQRLTTILILLIALRDKAKDIAGTLSEKIYEHYLTNKFNEDEDFFKLLPTQEDRDVFVNPIHGKAAPPKSKIKDAYSFFAKKLVDATKEQLENTFSTVATKLIFVSIQLAAVDNAYLIFEGLNAKGLPLTQADLIRNYMLMRVHRKRQDSVFSGNWLPMQKALGANLTEFIRHFLMRNASFIKQNEVYATLKAGTENHSEQDTIAFLVRRFVCAVPTHDLNKFFPTVLSQAKQNPSLTDGVAEILAKRSCPRNAEFRRHLFMMKMYGGGERGIKTKLILERLEESYGHKEEIQAKDLTIEHIMPQTLTDWWKAHLGDNWEHIQERYIHTIGNLTLTGYNPVLSNFSFEDKKKIYATSHVEMTKCISGDKWAEKEIKERIEELYKKAIVVWPSLGNATDEAMEEADEEDDLGEPVDVESGPVMITADIVDILGGGDAISSSKYCFRLKDGKGVLITASRQYPKAKPYWYGLSPAALNSIDSNGCTHVAFGMGSDLVALVPADVVKDYVKYCNVSKYKTGVIHHYHFFITKAEPHEMYGDQDSARIVLTSYLRKR
jgi:hypothetical protein